MSKHEDLGAPDHRGDIADQAAAQEERFRNLALQSAAAKAGREHHPGFDGEHCLDCTGEIGEGRLKLGKIRCVECQTALETARKRLGG